MYTQTLVLTGFLGAFVLLACATRWICAAIVQDRGNRFRAGITNTREQMHSVIPEIHSGESATGAPNTTELDFFLNSIAETRDVAWELVPSERNLKTLLVRKVGSADDGPLAWFYQTMTGVPKTPREILPVAGNVGLSSACAEAVFLAENCMTGYSIDLRRKLLVACRIVPSAKK